MRRDKSVAWLWFGVVVVAVVGGVALLMMGPPLLKLLIGVSRAQPTGAHQALATTATLSTSPPSPVAHGTTVTLTAIITPATVVGTVQFKDGATNLGPPVIVISGSASGTTSSLPAGTHTLTAAFTPANLAAYTPSVSPVVTFAVSAATTTSTTLAIAPTSPIPEATPITLTATIAPPTAAGTVQFKDGAGNIGNPVTVTSGAASGTTSMLAAGPHQLTAVFTPANPTALSPSTSPAVTTEVTGPAVTSTTLTTSPASPAAPGTPVTLTATITPSTAAGSVQFRDGDSNIGNPVTVSNGVASGSTSRLPAGSQSLTAMFTPTNTAAFTPSTSSTVDFMVIGTGGGTATSTALTTNPASPVSRGTPVTLIAIVTPTTATGFVQFKDGTINLGNPTIITNGLATTTTSTLTAGGHQLTATFIPADPAVFRSSTSPVLAFEVTPRGVADFAACMRLLQNCPRPRTGVVFPSYLGSIDSLSRTLVILEPVPELIL